jgi:4-amino-4-deoxy-L-arabinose transferase-like glycosyltransferase
LTLPWIRARPLLALAIVCLASTAARLAWLPAPCRDPCRSPDQHVLIFDEVYYVNAARVIAGITPPPGSNYANAPLGRDPNAEHPQLAKLIIAASIEALGDNPWGWRLPSVLCGTLTLLGMFALVRAAGGGRWLAVGAAALMATDNLLLVHGRIATLDIYTVTAMVWGVAAYLRGRWLLAGVLIGLSLCTKEVGAEALLVVALWEALRWWRPRRRGWLRLGTLTSCVGAAAATFIGLLAAMDRIAPPYDDGGRRFVTGGVFGHVGHILSYAGALTSPGGPKGIASYPIGWLVDYKPIPYLVIVPDHPGPGLQNIHPAVHFLGLINPPLLLAVLPALVVAVRVLIGTGRQGGSMWTRPVSALDLDLAQVGLSWFAATFVPFLVASLVFGRTSYLYYMVVVLPGLYLLAAWLMARSKLRKLTGMWVGLVALGAIIAYPLFPLPF